MVGCPTFTIKVNVKYADYWERLHTFMDCTFLKKIPSSIFKSSNLSF